MATFESSLEWSLPNEGGWSNHPNDKGGATNYGLTLGLAKKYGIETEEELKEVSQEKVADIFKAEFWRFDNVKSQQVATLLFDIALNSGLSRAVKIAQGACNHLGFECIVDGKWGPKTLACVNKVPSSQMVPTIQELRKEFYDSIIERDPSQEVFRKGWMNRCFRTLPEETEDVQSNS